MIAQPKKDTSTVNVDGVSKQRLIEGVRIRPAVTQVDSRGTLCEIFNPAWGFHPADLVYAYQFTIRPGKVKGWVYHEMQEDRLFLSFGTAKIVLYDFREDSPTYRLVNEIYLSEYNRGLIVFPAFVYHAIQNVSDKELVMINMPTRAYDHENPDKYRLPLDNDVIPYKFENIIGG
jgi:dTDP-4-dehydrorhamnose 3,5-epimerase